MPDEKVEVVDAAGDDVVVVETPPAKPPGAPIWALALVMIGLAALLMTMHFRNKTKQQSETPPSELAQMEAEAEIMRETLNRERAALGLSPLQGKTEALDDIAARLQKDSNTLVSLAGGFQEMLAKKDAEVAQKTAEILELEQKRHALTEEVGQLRQQLQQAPTDNPDTEALRRELGTVKDQRDRLAAELAGKEPTEDVEMLQRRLDEAQRARDFFEKRVEELEGAGLPEMPEPAEPDDGLIDVEE